MWCLLIPKLRFHYTTVFYITLTMTIHLLFQALPYVCLLILMLFFIYAIIGMQVSVDGNIYTSLNCIHWLYCRFHYFTDFYEERVSIRISWSKRKYIASTFCLFCNISAHFRRQASFILIYLGVGFKKLV